MIEHPDKLLLEMREAATRLAGQADGSRLARAVLDGEALIERLNLALEATCHLAESASTIEHVPDWVADFLNRRTTVENKLRAPLLAKRKGCPVAPLTPEELWALADELSVPTEFQPLSRREQPEPGDQALREALTPFTQYSIVSISAVGTPATHYTISVESSYQPTFEHFRRARAALAQQEERT